MSESLKIIFAGTPEFAVPNLQHLIEAGHQVPAVYTQPDRPVGRGRKLGSSAVKQCALELGLEVRQPAKLDNESVEALKQTDYDLMVVVAYGIILPQVVLDIPKLGCINVHASLLPRWRGAAPIQRAIEAGDAETGVTIMQMDAGLDTGDILKIVTCPINAQTTSASMHDALSALGASALIETIAGLQDHSIDATPQTETDACYAHRLSKAEAELDWTQPANKLDRAIRAFNPWPVAYTYFKDAPLRIWQAEPLDESHAAQPGTIMRTGESGIDIACGEGVLQVKKLQSAGKRQALAADFARGRDLTNLVLGR